MSRPILGRAAPAGWAMIFLVLAGALQTQIAFPLDHDTAYHAAVGRLIGSHGMLRSFPWTPFSSLADHYADKELLFHLLFVPLAGLDWITASRVVGTLCGAGLLWALYLILRAERVPLAGVWTLVSLSSSVLFLFRFVLVRPHLLSIPLTLIVCWAAARRRWIPLGIASTIFPWAYVAFWQLPLLMLVAVETSRLVSGRRVSCKPAFVVLGGLAAGLVCHPGAGDLLRVNSMHMVDVLFRGSWGARVGFDLGAEFGPYPLGGWVQGLLFNVAMLIAALVVAWKHRGRDDGPLAAALAASGFFVLAIWTARFAEYFVPFSILAAALSIPSVLKPRLRAVFPFAALGLTTAWMAFVQPHMLREWRERPNDMPPRIAAFLQAAIPAGAQVFTPSWDTTGLLLLTLPDRRFMVQLDPTFFYVKDPELYRLWYRICREAPEGSAEMIRTRFRARFVLGPNLPNWKKLFDELSTEPGVRELLLTDSWVLFDLEPGKRS